MADWVIRRCGVLGLGLDPAVIGPLMAILDRHLSSRSGGAAVQGRSDYTLTFSLDPALPAEGYELEHQGRQGCVIRGGCRLGLLYGLGRFLHEGEHQDGGFAPGSWQGKDAPVCSLRGIYLATHFNNYYCEAPVQEVVHYLQDVALWGCNTVEVWFDMHHYQGIDDPAAQAMIGRLQAILHGVKAMGLRVCMGMLGNEAYAGSPIELRADFRTGRAIYHCELCPSKPQAVELMLKWFDEVLDAFAEVRPDLLAFCPYDQGGCACEACRPWGCNGYLRIVEAKARRARQRWPDTRIILHTWLFDYGCDQGEWSGLSAAFKDGVDWCDYIQADSHERYPRFPLEQGVPGNLPLLNFPEISMWMMHPWGGFGANPLPARLESLWEEVRGHVAGGLPYSEGIYEDLNKVVCLQFYWHPAVKAKDTVRRYVAYEFGRAAVEPVTQALAILEANHNHLWEMNWHVVRQAHYPIVYRQDPDQAMALLKQADGRMTGLARQAWRWRIVYLRGVIDCELRPYEGYWASAACDAAFEELTRIYHAHNAELKCAPPSRRAVAGLRTSEYAVGSMGTAARVAIPDAARQ